MTIFELGKQVVGTISFVVGFLIGFFWLRKIYKDWRDKDD